MSKGPEWEKVEEPLLEHLASLGWDTLVWSERQSTDRVDRLSDRDVLLEQRLMPALAGINLGPNGIPWLDNARINAAAAELGSLPAGVKLFEANRLSTDLLVGRGSGSRARWVGWRSGSNHRLHRLERLESQRLSCGVAVPGCDTG